MAMQFCSACGSEATMDVQFCVSCGAPMSAKPGLAAVPVTALPPQSANQTNYVKHIWLASALVLGTLVGGFWYLSQKEDVDLGVVGAAAPPDATVRKTTSSADALGGRAKANESAAWEGEILNAGADDYNARRHYVIVGGAAETSSTAVAEAEAKAVKFGRCAGIRPWTNSSGNFAGMNSGYRIASFGGYADKRFADRVLKWARKCVPDAYIRTAQLLGD